jgi:hypothetical protein
MTSARDVTEELLARGAVDRSTNPTVVEYAVQDLFKGKSLAVAAKRTVEKLSNSENMFLGPGVTVIDAAQLEAALWDRLAESVVKSLPRLAPGKEHYALDGTLGYFKQFKLGTKPKPAVRARLKKLVITKLGYDPFTSDDVK